MNKSAEKTNINPPELSVVIPVYNNAGSIKELYERLCAALKGNVDSYEIIFVDDASIDDSCSIIKHLAGQDKNVRLSTLGCNIGQQKAVFYGLKNSFGRLIVTMDADLQDPPEAIPVMLLKIRQGYAAVFAGRRGRYESSFRLFTSRVFKFTMHMITGVPVDAGMFLIMTQEAKDRVLEFRGEPFLVSMLGCTRMPLFSMPVKRDRRGERLSAYTTRLRLKVALSAIFWSFVWRVRNK